MSGVHTGIKHIKPPPMLPPPKRELATTLEGRSAAPFGLGKGSTNLNMPASRGGAGRRDGFAWREAALQHTDHRHEPSLSASLQ